MNLQTDLPFILRDAYKHARKAKNAKDFIQLLANTRHIKNAPPKKIFDVPRVGSIIKTTLTSCNYEVMAVYSDRIEARKMNTFYNTVQIRREEVIKIVRGKSIPATSYDFSTRSVEYEYMTHLRLNEYSFLTDYYNKVQTKKTNKMRRLRNKRLEDFNQVLKTNQQIQAPKPEPERTGIPGIIENFNTRLSQFRAEREKGKGINLGEKFEGFEL